jgi:hypothetical protein
LPASSCDPAVVRMILAFVIDVLSARVYQSGDGSRAFWLAGLRSWMAV